MLTGLAKGRVYRATPLNSQYMSPTASTSIVFPELAVYHPACSTASAPPGCRPPHSPDHHHPRDAAVSVATSPTPPPSHTKRFLPLRERNLSFEILSVVSERTKDSTNLFIFVPFTLDITFFIQLAIYSVDG
jgi:hypothetical protein